MSEHDRDNDGVTDCIDHELRSPCPNNVNTFGVSINIDGDLIADCQNLCEGFDDNQDMDNDKIPDGCDTNPYCRGNKVVICHQGNNHTSTLCISPRQLARHLQHGDSEGPCSGVTSQSIVYESDAANETYDIITFENENIRIYPNPANRSFSISFKNPPLG